jgi:hypothetical protein
MKKENREPGSEKLFLIICLILSDLAIFLRKMQFHYGANIDQLNKNV